MVGNWTEVEAILRFVPRFYTRGVLLYLLAFKARQTVGTRQTRLMGDILAIPHPESIRGYPVNAEDTSQLHAVGFVKP